MRINKFVLPVAMIVMVLVVIQPRAARADVGAIDNNIWWNGVTHDQTATYLNPMFPTTSQTTLVKIRTNKNDLTGVTLRIWNGSVTNAAMSKTSSDASWDYWSYTIPANSGQVWYRFKLVDGSASAWYNIYGMQSAEPGSGDFTFIPIDASLGSFNTPQWMRDAIVYQIFPERFRNGNTGNDPTGTVAWGSAPATNNFMGGDLQGLINKLDYLNDGNASTDTDLGITAIYLNPIFESPSNHKYDTANYEAIDDNFGTASDFSTLITQAHARGIKVILDGVFNHTSVGHPFFQDVVSNGSGSAYWSWYTVNHWPITWYDDANCNHVWDSGEVAVNWNASLGANHCLGSNDYDSWAGYASLPNLVNTNAAVQQYIITNSNSITKRWLATNANANAGADGWRLDVGNEVEDSFWQPFRTTVKNQKSDAFIIGEYWGNALHWLSENMWDSTMNYRLVYGTGNNGTECFFGGSQESGNNLISCSTSVDAFDLAMYANKTDYMWQAYSTTFNLLDSHDAWRFLSQAGGDQWKLYAAAIFQMTYTGAPTIYYGDEVGMGNYTGLPKDPGNRAAMEWSDITQPDGKTFHNPYHASISALYRDLIRVRLGHSALRTPQIVTLYRNNTDVTYAYARKSSSETVIVAINNSTSPKNLTIPLYGLFGNGTVLKDELSGNSYTVSGGNVVINNLDGHFGAILVTTPVLSKPHVTFQVNGYVTSYGQNMYVVGSVPELGSWNTNNAVPLNWVDSDSWVGMVTFTTSKGTTIQYKYIVKNPNGSIIWESDPNRSYMVPNWGDRFVTDTWH